MRDFRKREDGMKWTSVVLTKINRRVEQSRRCTQKSKVRFLIKNHCFPRCVRKLLDRNTTFYSLYPRELNTTITISKQEWVLGIKTTALPNRTANGGGGFAPAPHTRSLEPLKITALRPQRKVA